MKSIFISTLFFLLFPLLSATAQNLESDRSFYKSILKEIKNDIKDKYYDPKLTGINIEEKAKDSVELIGKAKSIEEMRDIIGHFSLSFEDFHLLFIPPRNTFKIEYGWEMMFIGDKALVTQVDQGSDADRKGVKAGDQIYMVDGFIPTREDFWKLKYLYELVNPKTSLVVILIKPNGNKYRVELKAKVTENKLTYGTTQLDRRNIMIEDQNTYDKKTKQLQNDKIPGLFVWKLPSLQVSRIAIDKTIDKVRKAKSLILDLRGNDELSESIWKTIIRSNQINGLIPTINQNNVIENDTSEIAFLWLCSYFFNDVVSIAEVKRRNNTKTLKTRDRDKDVFHGEIVVLIDSGTGAESEMTARILQLEKRAKVIGDKSAGSVMKTEFFSSRLGADTFIPYGMNIPIGDIIMKDGQRLEKIGVTPDEKILPTSLDLLNKRDPVMARAAQILGFSLTTEDAGNLFSDKK
jgi:C-terminal processing protease CtpA/Prc